MSGLWLKNGMHYNITDEAAKEMAEEIKKTGSATFLGSEVKMVLPTLPGTPREINNSKIILKKPATKK